MCGAFALGFLLLAHAGAHGPSASCPADGCPHGEAGPALLQVGAEARGSRSETDEQLVKYAKLKAKLAESKDAADIMTSIDMALDGSGSAHGSDAEDAERVDDILDDADAEIDEDADSSEGRPDEPLADATGGEEKEDAEYDDSEEDEADRTEDDTDESTKALSLLSVLDVKEADSVPLNQDGYMALAISRSNRKMERFVERLLEKMHLEVVDEGGLKGMVPYYSGQKARQSFAALRTELATTSRTADSWVAKKAGSWLAKNSKVKKMRPEARSQKSQSSQKNQKNQKNQKPEAPKSAEPARKISKPSPKRS